MRMFASVSVSATCLIMSVFMMPDERAELYTQTWQTRRAHNALEITREKEAFGGGLVCFKPHLESVVCANENCEQVI